ncbi:hypothetical protein B9479_008355 [Cryptococcus floricola]|uniref:Helitron helicase-like domain-containing protein n=1 Tax=Cryptococcus floricola TaxID=2591691 RepID=A0A5D3AM58_9TREE|nr:hypothetical protein B9479_008355 [Cryptococcus floricola]
MSQEGHDPRTCNTPTSNNVALIYDNSNDPDPNGRELIWQSRPTNSLNRIPELSEHFVPLHFPLLFPYGEPGWHPRIPLNNPHDPLHYSSSVQLVSEMAHDETAAYGTNTASTDTLLTPFHTHVVPTTDVPSGRNGSHHVTQAQFYAYSLFKREHVFNILHHAGLLFQEYLDDVWAQTEAAKLRFQELNQKLLRTDLKRGLADAIQDELEADAVGKQVYLSRTSSTGPHD